MNQLRIVSATRLGPDSFWKESFLGRSLQLIPEVLRPEVCITFDNVGPTVRGLSSIYNEAIDAAPDDVALLFVHDDVFIHDPFLAARIAEAFKQYDVVGLVGSRGADPRQPSFVLAFDENLNKIGWQPPRVGDVGMVLSGAVSHPGPTGAVPLVQLNVYGPLSADCTLLDGLFLAASAAALNAKELRFDEAFDFHLYDIDFCRSASQMGLRLGTWPICVSHLAQGDGFGSEAFKVAARRYLDKWRTAT